VYEYIVTGRKSVGDQGQGGERNAQADGTSRGGFYHVDIEDDPNLLDMIRRLTLIPIK
jgi:hypothetical protein